VTTGAGEDAHAALIAATTRSAKDERKSDIFCGTESLKSVKQAAITGGATCRESNTKAVILASPLAHSNSIKVHPTIRWAVWASVLAVLSCSRQRLQGGLSASGESAQHTGVCYEVFVRSFADADGDGVGDLRGLTAHLDYINDGNSRSTTDLGANCIWLMPIAKSVSYHGYDVTDYYHVDRRYGTDADFRALVRAAHRRGIRVIVDFVPNHSSSENPWFQSALENPASPYRSWYRWSPVNPNQPGPWGQVAWHRSPVRDEYYYGVFWEGMPDLNYQTPVVTQEMKKVTAYWLTKMGVDGFRFDAIPYLVEEGDQLKHTRGTHQVLHVLGDAIRREAPRSFTVGEMGDGSVDVLASYYPDQLDSYFAFDVAKGTIEAARTGDGVTYERAVREASAKLPAGRWSPFLTNHDQPRTMTVLSDMAKARVAASAMLVLPGVAFVYYGEEIGMVGPKPDEQIRTPMQWSSAAKAGFTTGTPWETLQPDWTSKNVAAEDGDPASLLNHYRKLIHLRNQHPALDAGDVALGNSTNPAIVGIVRHAPEETILAAVNFGDRTIDRVHIALAAALRGRLFRLETLYNDPSSACRVMLVEDGAVTLGAVAAHSLCVFRVLDR
jgi:glycosidase